MSSMSTFVSALRNGAKLLERSDDDGFDRLSNRYSIGMLVMMVAFISVKSYVGEPIACFPPNELATIQWRKYVDNHCWTTNTYYVPLDKDLQPTIPPGGLKPGDKTDYQQEIAYYQWVPIILSFVAFMFAIPANIWSWASNSGGYDVEAMVKATKGTTNLNPEVRDKTIAYLVAQMDRLLGYRRPIDRKGFMGKVRRRARPIVVSKRLGSFLFIMYLFVKCLYILNAIGLLYILNWILGDGYNYWGIELIRKLRDPDYQGTARFPYNTLCDMWLRRLGSNQHRYTIQCTMSVNLFNEKVFMILWFWLAFVAGASILGLILWLFTAYPSVNKEFARKYLGIMARVNRHDTRYEELINEFVHTYLRLDGMFCMRLIVKNTNDAIGGEILAACWDHFLLSRKPTLIEPTLPEHRLLSDETV